MSRLGEIEEWITSEDGKGVWIDADDARLLVCAVRQLGALYDEVFSNHNAADIRHYPCAICDIDMRIDEDVLDLISPDQITTVESKG